MNKLHKAGKPPRISYRGLSAILGVVTLVTLGTEQFLSDTSGQSLGELPAYVMVSVLLVVGVSAFYASVNGQEIRAAVLLSLGPIRRLFVYLVGNHLVLPRVLTLRHGSCSSHLLGGTPRNWDCCTPLWSFS